MAKDRSVARNASSSRLVSGKTAYVTRLGDGTYRVSSKRSRSAITGRFITRSAASRLPTTTVAETRGNLGRAEAPSRPSAKGTSDQASK